MSATTSRPFLPNMTMFSSHVSPAMSRISAASGATSGPAVAKFSDAHHHHHDDFILNNPFSQVFEEQGLSELATSLLTNHPHESHYDDTISSDSLDSNPSLLPELSPIKNHPGSQFQQFVPTFPNFTYHDMSLLPNLSHPIVSFPTAQSIKLENFAASSPIESEDADEDYEYQSSRYQNEADDVEEGMTDDTQKESRKRARTSRSVPATVAARPSKGLRHFALKVCEKVESLRSTTHNFVADAIVKDLIAEKQKLEEEGIKIEDKNAKRGKRAYEEQNIRRRVYDALNVLWAMGIIQKSKKSLEWIGLPDGIASQLKSRMDEKNKQISRLSDKRQKLSELCVRYVAMRNLIEHNRGKNSRAFTSIPGRSSQDLLATLSSPSSDPFSSVNNISTTATTTPLSTIPPLPIDAIPLSFILVKTSPSTLGNIVLNPERTVMQGDFTAEFEVFLDTDLLSTMGLSKIDSWDLPRIISPEICPYFPQEHIKHSSATSSTSTSTIPIVSNPLSNNDSVHLATPPQLPKANGTRNGNAIQNKPVTTRTRKRAKHS